MRPLEATKVNDVTWHDDPCECASPLRESTPTLRLERTVTQLPQDLRARRTVQVYGWANELALVLNGRGRGDKHLPELRRQSGCLMNEGFLFFVFFNRRLAQRSPPGDPISVDFYNQAGFTRLAVRWEMASGGGRR